MARTKKPLVFRDRNTKEKIPFYVKTEDVELPDGTDIGTKIGEIEDALDGAADGTVKSVTLNNVTVEPDANGDVDLGEIEQAEQKQADWEEDDTAAPAYIKHKPTKLSEFTNDEGFTDNAGTVTGVKMNGGNAATPDSNGVVDLGTVITTHQSLAALFGKVAYDGTTHRINFYGKDDVSMTTVLGYIDCSPFIVDGMLSNVDVKNVTINNVSTLCMVFSFNTDAGKQNINIPVSSIFNAANYYTKGEVDDALDGKVDKENGKSLMTDAERTKLQGLPTNPVTSITVNGQTKTPTNGNVNIEVQGGAQGKSAYQSYLETTSDSPVKSEAEWVASLRGADGVASGDDVFVVHNYDGEPSNLEQGQVAVLGADLGPSIGKIFNANTQDANNGTPYRLWVGTQEQLDAIEEYDEDVIYLVGTVPTVAQKFNLDVSDLTNVSVPANTPAKVKEGSEFSIVLTPASGYTIDTATGTMAGGGTLTKTNNQNGTVTFSTTSVTGAITITASASVHISSVAVSAGTRNVNAIPLTAVLNAGGSPAPAGVTYNWSVPSGTTKFSVTGNGATATLNVLSGAVANDSVVVTCAASNGTSNGSGTVTVTISEAYNDRVDITALGAVSHAAGSDVNTFQFSVGKTPPDGNYPEVVWSLGSCVPAGAASIDAGTGLLTVTADCTVTVTATAGNMSSTSDAVSLEYNNAVEPIRFEDMGVKRILLNAMGKTVPSDFTDIDLLTDQNSGSESQYKITYAEAAAATPSLDGFYQKTGIETFREFRYFTSFESVPAKTGVTESVFSNSSLKRIDFPSSLTSWDCEIQNAMSLERIDLRGTGITSISRLFKDNVSTNANPVPFKLFAIFLPEGVESAEQLVSGNKAQNPVRYIVLGPNFKTHNGLSGNFYMLLHGTSYPTLNLVFTSATPPTTFALEHNAFQFYLYVPKSAEQAYREKFAAFIAKTSKYNGVSYTYETRFRTYVSSYDVKLGDVTVDTAAFGSEYTYHINDYENKTVTVTMVEQQRESGNERKLVPTTKGSAYNAETGTVYIPFVTGEIAITVTETTE